MQKHFADSDETCRYIRENSGGTVILAFSRGKDALGAWLQLRRFFDTVIPYHMELVPGMAFVERSLVYYERFFGTVIHRYIHPSFYRWLTQLTFQPPERCAVIENTPMLRGLKYDDLVEDLRRRLHLPDAWVATGVRAVDSPLRMMAVRKHGAANYKRRSFMPVWDWRADRLHEELVTAKVRLPVDYHLWQRTFDGLDHRFLGPLRERFPEDYARVLEWFPLADLEFYRRECAARRAG